MNTSYNYSDFIGLNLSEGNEHETCVDNKINHQGKTKTPQPCENTAQLNDEFNAQLNDEFNKDKTVE